MRYDNVRTGIFRQRPNRFIAIIDIDGTDTMCHVKNTGRCKELLVPGCTVVLQAAAHPARKTPYDVIAVYKGHRLINMDSQAPNEVAAQWLTARFPGETVRREVTYGDSRLDFAVGDWLIEVKGCTLERDGVGYFPDAPTQRGVKHLRHLIRAVEEGHQAAALFIVQMEGITALRPNDDTHPAFGDTLRQAVAAGVQVWAVGCHVAPDSLEAAYTLPVEL